MGGGFPVMVSPSRSVRERAPDCPSPVNQNAQVLFLLCERIANDHRFKVFIPQKEWLGNYKS
jgi:hypothetical protein